MTTTVQTLGVGTAQPQRWAAALAGRNASNQFYPLDKLTGVFVGERGNGKSSILQTNPDCFILNVDRTAAVVRPLQAVMWPVVDHENGNIVDESGRPIVLTFEHVQDKVKQLVALARTNDNRPACVGLDSLPGLLALGKMFLARKNNKATWNELWVQDRKWYDRLYEMIEILGYDLRQAGYGIFWTCTLTKKVLSVSQEIQRPAVEWPFSDTFANRIFDLADLIMPVTVEARKVTTQGQPDAYLHERYVDFTDPFTMGAAKGRNLEGKIKLERNAGWQSLVAAYNAQNPVTAPTS